MRRLLHKTTSALSTSWKRVLNLSPSLSREQPKHCRAKSCKRPGCIIPPPPAHSFPITSLPVEIQLSVASHLSFWDVQAMRHTNRHFHNLIPPPTHDELLAAEQEWAGYLYFHHYVPQPRSRFYACAGCLRLRHRLKFDTGYGVAGGYTGAHGFMQHCRFCVDCRDQSAEKPGLEKWMIGKVWNRSYKAEMEMLWCKRCERSGIVPRWEGSGPAKMCLRCLTVDWGNEDVKRMENRALERRRVKRQRRMAELKHRWEVHVKARKEARRRWQAAGRNLAVFDEEYEEDREPLEGVKLDMQEDMLGVNLPDHPDIERYCTDFP